MTAPDVEVRPTAPSLARGGRDKWVFEDQASWRRLSTVVAVIGTVLISARITLPHLVTVGDLVAVGMLPVWFPVLRRYVGVTSISLLALLCIPCGLLLTIHAARDHDISRGNFFGATVWIVGVVTCVGFLLWARERIGLSSVAVLFGVGLVLGIDPSDNLFSSNPWKFGFCIPVTILALAIAFRLGSRWLELAAAAVLLVVCLFTDTRAALGILLMTIAFVAWQMRPSARTRKGSAARVFLGAGLTLVVIFYVSQALLLGGALGASTQARSQVQLHNGGSLLLGGRPEALATIRLIQDNPMGPGAGAMPNYHEVVVAKTGMAQINYDPNNGYVEHVMFGTGYSLHSVFGDLWAQWGLVGLLFAVTILVFALARLSRMTATSTLPAVALYTAFFMLWNFFFAPWYSTLSLLELTLVLLLARRPEPPVG